MILDILLNLNCSVISFTGLFLSKKVKEKPGSIITKLYYWEITNKDGFLFKGESPQVSFICHTAVHAITAIKIPIFSILSVIQVTSVIVSKDAIK